VSLKPAVVLRQASTIGSCSAHAKNSKLCMYMAIFGQPFVKRFALCYRTVARLSALSVTLVYCGQTVEWIKMKLGMEVSLGLGHILLDGDPASPPMGHSRHTPIFGPCLWWPNGRPSQLLLSACSRTAWDIAEVLSKISLQHSIPDTQPTVTKH